MKTPAASFWGPWNTRANSGSSRTRIGRFPGRSWKRSAIGHLKEQKRTIRALGLRRLGQTVEHSDSRSLRGMITKVKHLVAVEEVNG